MTILTKIDLEKEKYTLIRRHIQDRRAHFDKDIATLLAGMAAEQINVRDGRVNTRHGDETDTICAWLMVYEKQEGNWVAVANASTFASPSSA